MATKTASAPAGIRTAKAAGMARGKAPTKTDINFADLGVKHSRWYLAVLGIIVILLAAAAIAKFAVIDRLAEVDLARSEASVVQAQLDLCNARIESYGELNDQYAHYTYSGMTAEELGRVDRVEVVSLLERVVYPRTDVTDWSLTGNKLSLTIQGRTLQKINDTVQKLQADSMVDYWEVNTATTGEKARNADKEEKVSANIVIYLQKPEEVEE